MCRPGCRTCVNMHRLCRPGCRTCVNMHRSCRPGCRTCVYMHRLCLPGCRTCVNMHRSRRPGCRSCVNMHSHGCLVHAAQVIISSSPEGCLRASGEQREKSISSNRIVIDIQVMQPRGSSVVFPNAVVGAPGNNERSQYLSRRL